MTADLVDLCRRSIQEHRLVLPGDRVLTAVSGGADSVALLHLLQAIAPTLPFTLEAAHLDHGLRPESRQDAEFVSGLCERWGVFLTTARIPVKSEARRRRLGVEETAREVRREFLQQTARCRGCRVIALGHHRGDQAETVLHRLLRGSGASGLAGMVPARGPFIRPLLGATAGQIREYLEALGLPWVEDASNASPAFTRNRIRHSLLPRLAEFNPRIEEALARLGGRLALEDEYWRAEAERTLAGLTLRNQEGLRLDCRNLLALHPALRARVLRQALEGVRGHLRGLASIHLDLLEALLLSERPQADLHLPGAWAGRRYGELWLRTAPPVPGGGFSLQVPGPGTVSLPGGGELAVSLESRAQGEDARTVEFDPAAVPFPLTIRSWRPGDRIHPAGMDGRRKVKAILGEARVERERRAWVPLVESSEILWIVGLRRCEGRRPLAAGTVLRLAFRLSGP